MIMVTAMLRFFIWFGEQSDIAPVAIESKELVEIVNWDIQMWRLKIAVDNGVVIMLDVARHFFR